MKKLVILEGPDGAGKTTLAGEMLALYDFEGAKAVIVHAGPPAKNSNRILPTMLYHALTKFEQYDVVIMDRSPLSETVYGPILRGRILGTYDEWQVWDDVQAGNVGFEVELLLLDASDETLLHRAYGVRGEDYVPPEKFMDIVNAYRSLYSTQLEKAGWIKVITDANPDE